MKRVKFGAYLLAENSSSARVLAFAKLDHKKHQNPYHASCLTESHIKLGQLSRHEGALEAPLRWLKNWKANLGTRVQPKGPLR